MSAPADFMFATCQVGAETALKEEVARKHPLLRVAFSRPGLLTFKLPEDHKLRLDFALNATFARSHGFSLGTVKGDSDDALAAAVWETVGESTFHQLHCWPRDTFAPGDHDFEPHVSEDALAARDAIVRAMPGDQLPEEARSDAKQVAQREQLVLDCILVEGDTWLVGVHQTTGLATRYAGGMVDVSLPEGAISRAYLKMEEGLRWARMPLAKGDKCVDLGCAPGGASQALLKHGAHVMGVDPADVDPRLLEHPNFQHVKKRAVDLRRREFVGIRWLFADMIVAPQYTLDTVEAIVSNQDVHIGGMLLTLKLLDWKLAAELPAYLDRIRGWGYRVVNARQLRYNRQEVCVAAFRRREVRRPVRARAKPTK